MQRGWQVLWLAVAALAGCGGDNPSREDTSARARTVPASDIASHVVGTDRFLGFPRLEGSGDQVRRDAGAFVADAPFLYTAPDKAVADLKKSGFVAGIIRIFKNDRGIGSSGSVALELRDERAAAAEKARQVASAAALPCPRDAKCTRKVERFTVPGVAGAKGVDLTTTFEKPLTEDGVTFKVSHDLSIVFTDSAIVHQLFAGGPGMAGRRDDLVAAARQLYDHNR